MHASPALGQVGRVIVRSAVVTLLWLVGPPPARAIVGGSPAAITEFPYQVALVQGGASAYAGQFCGGTIRDATHIVTAAHCVFDNALTEAGEAADPGTVDVVAGIDTLSKEAEGQRIDVVGVAVDPPTPRPPPPTTQPCSRSPRHSSSVPQRRGCRSSRRPSGRRRHRGLASSSAAGAL